MQSSVNFYQCTQSDLRHYNWSLPKYVSHNQAIPSCLDYWNTLLTCLPGCAVKSLEMVKMVKNAGHIWFSVSLESNHHPSVCWLAAACFIFKSLMLTNKVVNGTAPNSCKTFCHHMVTLVDKGLSVNRVHAMLKTIHFSSFPLFMCHHCKILGTQLEDGLVYLDVSQTHPVERSWNLYKEELMVLWRNFLLGKYHTSKEIMCNAGFV